MRVFSWGLGALLLVLGGLPAHAQLRPAGPPVRLLADAAPALHPVWSPDGSRLAFTRATYAGLWTVGVDGDGVRQLSDAPGAGFGFSWSPDGSALLARTARTDGLRRFHTPTVIDVQTGEATALTEERASMPSLPRWAGPHHVALYTDGALDVVAVDAEARTAAPDAAVLEADGALAVAESGALRTVSLPDGGAVLNVTPSPDGRRVAFERLGGDLYVLDLDSGAADGPRPRRASDVVARRPVGRVPTHRRRRPRGHGLRDRGRPRRRLRARRAHALPRPPGDEPLVVARRPPHRLRRRRHRRPLPPPRHRVAR